MGLRFLRWAAVGAVLAVGLAVSACGAPPGSKPAAQLVPELHNAVTTATSVHVAGSLIKGNQTTTIDVSLDSRDGGSVAGYLGAYGTRYYVLSLRGQSYVKLNAAFLKAEGAPASLCATVCGKWVSLPFASGAQIIGFLSMQQLVQGAFSTSSLNATAHSGCLFVPTTWRGLAVLQCRQGSNTLDVDAHGQPYVVYWSGPNGVHLAFSDWDSVVLPPLPPASQVISSSALS
jgi:hypothetical protein